MSKKENNKEKKVMIIGCADSGKYALMVDSILADSQNVIHSIGLPSKASDKINPEKLADLKSDLDAIILQEMEKDKREAEAIFEITNPRKDMPELFTPPPTRAERRAADRKKAKKNQE